MAKVAYGEGMVPLPCCAAACGGWVRLLAHAAVAWLVAMAACSGRGPVGAATPATSVPTAVTAGAAPPGATSGDAAVTYTQQIAPLLQAKCNGCHSAGGIGPFTLTSYADVVAHQAALGAAVQDGLMPPWPPAAGCQDYTFELSLDDGQRQMLLAWLQGGMPQGTGTPVAAAAPVAIADVLRVDATLTPSAPYRPRLQPDEYRCFVLPWTQTVTKYMTGSDVVPGNSAVVHHVAVYVASGAASSFHEGADGFPGFPCTASPAGVSHSLTGWRPGARADIYAADGSVGTRIDPNTVIVMQVHYHVEGDLAAVVPDQTSVVMQLAGSVAREGFPVTVSNPLWVLSPNTMSIPAGDANVVHSYTTSPFFWWDYWTRAKPYTQLSVLEVAAHAHLLATQVHVTINRGQQSICLLDIPRWSFHWQSSYHLSTAVTLQAGDTVTLSCQWDNSAANQPVVGGVKQAPATVVWGEDSADEMCVTSLYLVPPP